MRPLRQLELGASFMLGSILDAVLLGAHGWMPGLTCVTGYVLIMWSLPRFSGGRV